MFVIPIVGIILGFVAYFMYRNYGLKFRRSRYIKKSKTFRNEWLRIIQQQFKYNELINNTDRFMDMVSILIQEKNWPTQASVEDKVLTSAYASLPLMNRETNYYPGIQSFPVQANLEFWLDKNESQFASDFGKLVMHEFGSDFKLKALMYFDDPKKLESEDKKRFDLLKQYFK